MKKIIESFSTRFGRKLREPIAEGRTLSTPAGPELAALTRQALEAKNQLLSRECRSFIKAHAKAVRELIAAQGGK